MASQSFSSTQRRNGIADGRLCTCGLTPALKTSWSSSNYGRRYFQCPLKACGYYDWLDPPVHGQVVEAPMTAAVTPGQVVQAPMTAAVTPGQVDDCFEGLKRAEALISDYKRREQMYFIVVVVSLVVAVLLILFK
ncbi:uncharacterized protein LOC130721850 [Lotus japonicus]|uniref:uncharacterized protein LOC130721850 n=1 Tax=Lotus japonicus TaxID=34305 RepID=UPI00258BF3A1|nr:uncharacterized protein LOC130721850 [Lotus japonicus]